MIIFIKLFSLILILVILLRFKFNISISLLVLSLYSILLFRIGYRAALSSSLEILTADISVQLYIIIVCVLFISTIQKTEKMFDRLTASLNSIFRDNRIVAIVAPAMIGFLPMPGGALVSAPLVDAAARDMDIRPEFKTFLNYWFRHVWEFVWPIYAGLLLFQAMSGIPLKKIILIQSLYTILNIISGIVITSLYLGEKKVKNSYTAEKRRSLPVLKDFLEGIWPVVTILILFFAFSLPLYLSLMSTSVILVLIKRIIPKRIIKILFSGFIFKTLALIASVLIFQNIINISDIFKTFSGNDISFNIMVMIIFFVSFSTGFLTGVNTAYIAIAYPLLLPLFSGNENFINISIYIYVTGFAGVLLSPLHLCFVLTNEYFKSTLVKVYKYLTPPVLMLILFATLMLYVR